MNGGILGLGGLTRPPSAAVPLRVTVITTPGAGTFAKLPATRWMRVKRSGGGGGGGGNPSPCVHLAQGGRRGAYCEDWLQATASTYAYTVGAGGAAGAALSVDGGGDGGDTTFAGLLPAPGGAGGPPGMQTNTEFGNGAPGESGPYGGGGRMAAAAPAGRGHGSGGGVSYNANAPGGAGAPGLIIIEEY